ncbi:hypothetical protein EV424DRAFT_1354373 [Suillus variegatus]|nr:hypothetical protein EV424DRAFT_1354373 [Suillus variegatus]
MSNTDASYAPLREPWLWINARPSVISEQSVGIVDSGQATHSGRQRSLGMQVKRELTVQHDQHPGPTSDTGSNTGSGKDCEVNNLNELHGILYNYTSAYGKPETCQVADSQIQVEPSQRVVVIQQEGLSGPSKLVFDDEMKY